MIGSRFGKLLVLEENVVRSKGRHIVYKCICDCGKEKLIKGTQLRRGTKSCGCIRIEKLYVENPVSIHPMYNTWLGMKSRCYNKNNLKFPSYGGRGIIVCDEWRKSFLNFLEDMGE